MTPDRPPWWEYVLLVAILLAASWLVITFTERRPWTFKDLPHTTEPWTGERR